MTAVARRHPPWLKVRAPGGPGFVDTQTAVRSLGLHTVCEEAQCPNIGECWGHRTATFMLLGDVCTRNCTFCAVRHGRPLPVDPDEPTRIARAVGRLGQVGLGGKRQTLQIFERMKRIGGQVASTEHLPIVRRKRQHHAMQVVAQFLRL